MSRPLSDYNLFVASFKGKMPGMSPQDRMRAIAQLWNQRKAGGGARAASPRPRYNRKATAEEKLAGLLGAEAKADDSWQYLSGQGYGAGRYAKSPLSRGGSACNALPTAADCGRHPACNWVAPRGKRAYCSRTTSASGRSGQARPMSAQLKALLEAR